MIFCHTKFWASWLNPLCFWLVFWKFPFCILAITPNTLTEIFMVVLSLSRKMFGYCLVLVCHLFVHFLCSFCHHPTIQCSVVLATSSILRKQIEIFVHVGCYSAWLVVSYWCFGTKEVCLTLDDGTDSLTWDISSTLQRNTA